VRRNGKLRVAFVGGPMYDYPYSRIPEFESKTGYEVEIGAKLIHPELNEHIAELYGSGVSARSGDELCDRVWKKGCSRDDAGRYIGPRRDMRSGT